MKKAYNRNIRYRCVGENIIKGIEFGDCGDTRTLRDWLIHLNPWYTKEELESLYDENYTNQDLIDDIYEHKGKRLIPE